MAGWPWNYNLLIVIPLTISLPLFSRMIFQFRIEIKNISSPKVWRRTQIPSQWSFDRFHRVLQAAFGWENCHLYLFSPKGWGSDPCIGSPDWEDSDCQNAAKIKLRDYFGPAQQKITYIYDFGDNWIHHILLEEIIDENRINADLLEGKGKCPPEDCGGSHAYMDLKEILGDPEYPEYNEIREWIGMGKTESWDPNGVDLNTLRLDVHAVR